jgi:ketosteroid isomerase-like protein
MDRKLTVEQVRAEVLRFRNAFAMNDKRTLRSLYSSEAGVFNPSNRYLEPGPLTAARCSREYSHPQCAMKFQLGEIHVVLLGEHAEAAVASYTFELHATNVTTALGLIDRHVEHGRATHVFAYNAEGALVMMHEHRSEAAKLGRPAASLPRLPDVASSFFSQDELE